MATSSSYMYSMRERTDVRTLRVCLQQRSSKVTWKYTWNLTLRRCIYVCLLFVLSQCDFCSPAWRLCTTWMASCKGPIVDKIFFLPRWKACVRRTKLGHFRVPRNLAFKARLTAKPLIWKWFLIMMQIKLIFTTKVSHLASFWKWEFLELGNDLFLRTLGAIFTNIQCSSNLKAFWLNLLGCLNTSCYCAISHDFNTLESMFFKMSLHAWPCHHHFAGNPVDRRVTNIVSHYHQKLAWDQAQFERFSHILSNGYR